MAAWKSPPSSPPMSPVTGSSTAQAKVTPVNLATESSPLFQPLTLVIPTIRAPKLSRRPEAFYPKPGRQHPGRLKGLKSPRDNSIDVVPPQPFEENWVAPLGKFAIEQDAVELEGYQMYAVEKWVVDRKHFMKVVVVFTGDVKDVVTVTVITPLSTLTNEQAQAEYDEATRLLRRDGAKPRMTPLGPIMATSLANFRSDLNIVQIPGGNFLAAQGRLYVNINLLRLGCSGRTALTVEEPSEAVQERFRQLYSIPAISAQRIGFGCVVLEFIKLVQAALAIFELFELTEERDGLLCDMTVENIRAWSLDVGEQLQDIKIEATERVLDPSVVAAILSVITSVRAKLAAILSTSANVPKDPFQQPRAFTETLAMVCPTHMTRQTPNAAPRAFLSAALVEYINRQYKRKVVESRTHRLNPSSLVSLLPTDTFPGPVAGIPRPAAEQVVPETSDLISFSKSSLVISKDPIETLQLIWTGKMGPALTHAKHAQLEKERRAAEERDAENKSDARSGEDEEGLLNKGLYVIRKGGQEFSARLTSLPSLPGANRKKQSIDASSGVGLFPPSLSSVQLSPNLGPRRQSHRQETLSSQEEPRAMSADEGYSRSHRPVLYSLGSLGAYSSAFTSPVASRAPMPLDMRLKTKSLELPVKFSTKWSKTRKNSEQWAVPPTPLDPEMQSDDDGMCSRIRISRFHPSNHPNQTPNSVYAHDELKRRHSFDDLEKWRDVPCLAPEQMKTDVRLMASLREIGRRKRRLNIAREAVKELIQPLIVTREILRDQMNRRQSARYEFDHRVNTILPAVQDLMALHLLQLRVKELEPASIHHNTTFKANAISAAETLKSSKYKTSSEIKRIPELKSEVRKHREQFWQQRRLAYLPPETKRDEEDLTLSLGSKCPFLWSLQALYKLMLLTILWAGMVRRGEIQPNMDDGWRRSSVFGTKLDRKGRTQGDLDMLVQEEKEDRALDWTMRATSVSAQSFASL